MMIGTTEIIQSVIYFISLYYVVFWLLVLLDSMPHKKKNMKNPPEVSIIVPAYNEEKNIVKTLESITKLDYPKDKVKIIFVDDGSKDKTYKLANDYLKKVKREFNYKDIIVLTQKNQGKYSALNNALKYVDTELFATLDADSFPEKTALKNIVYMFSDEKVGAVSPVLKVYKPANNIQRIQWFEYSVNHFYKSMISRLNAIHVTPGPLSTYRTKIVSKIGGFREAHKTEDMEIAMRIQKSNYKIVQCNDAFVYTKAPYRIRDLYVQRHRWNYGTLRNVWDYKRMMFNKKYGDFGVFQLPVILISGFLSITILGIIIFETFKSSKSMFKVLKVYNFNLIEYFKNVNFNMIWLDLDLRSIIAFGVFFIISIIIIYLSLKLYKERYVSKNIFSFMIYVLFYYLFLSIVWMGVLKDVLLKRGTTWKK